jgi:hypothetical protein
MKNKKFWGESPYIYPIKEVNVGDVVLVKFARQYYSLGWIVSQKQDHLNIFGDLVEGFLVSDQEEVDDQAIVIIISRDELRQNDETISMNRDRKINLLLNEKSEL